ncbi:hypothetical protein [Providencia alcalifaciens]|uniref:hypothetical protein n=1 Tax=Providencia alcalifaciens TaxID=126385 RepID=UPI0012B64975|nr:hypothetical protein [Providencia alcalifaciens]MTC15647.1 hypothetical protein [Providencia alcalifaciens]
MTKLAQLKKVYDELGKKQLKVGFFEHSQYTDGTPIAYVAAIQELGHGAIPPRPFMRPTMTEHRQEYSQLIGRAAKAAVKGNITVSEGLKQVGEKAVGDIQMTIRSIQTPPLSMVTLLLRKRRKQEGFKAGGKAVGQAYCDANFIGPRSKKDKTVDVSGVSTKPLVDEGLMLQSVSCAVEDK